MADQVYKVAINSSKLPSAPAAEQLKAAASGPSARPRPDFVQVQLTAAGVAFAKGGPVTVSNGRRSLTFTAGKSTELERSYEWNAWLSRHTLPNGDALLELAPASTPAGNAPVAAAVPGGNDDGTAAVDAKAAPSAPAQPAPAQNAKPSTAAATDEAAAAVSKS